MRAFSWGCAEDGQLGIASLGEVTCVTTAKEVSMLTGQRVRSISCGLRHTSILLQDGTVYTCGTNDRGQQGQDRNHFRPVQVSALETMVITQITCGDDHTLAISDRCQVLGWGRNDRGQCGLATGDREDKPKPRILKSLGSFQIVQVACGSLHSMALTRDGRVFSWGDNSYGQLGIGSPLTQFSDRPLELVPLRGLPIIRLTCGGSHSFALSVSGSPFGWGKNDFGQLGIGNRQNQPIPHELHNLQSHFVQYIACGQDHTAMLTANGGVFLFGLGMQGQLGHGSKNSEINPRKVIDLMGSDITQVACGRQHTLVLEGHTGRMFSFGLGTRGQLGLNKTNSYASPMAVPGPWLPYKNNLDMSSHEGFIIKSIYAGGDHNFCTVSHGSDSESPMDFREPSPTQRPAILTEKLLRELCTVTPKSSPSAKVQRMAELVFSSASCLNASFLKENREHFNCTSDPKRHGVDLDAARSAFQHIAGNAEVLEMISEVIIAHLVPSLMIAQYQSVNAEAHRLYLILMESPVLSLPSKSWCRRTILQIGRALLQSGDGPAPPVYHWWSGLIPRHLKRIVTVHKECVAAILDGGPTIQHLPTEEKQTLGLCMTVLANLNKVNLMRGEILPFYLFQIPDLRKYIDLHQHFQVCVQKWSGHVMGDVFTFCDFPFVFDIDMKTELLQLDALLQMHFAMEDVQRRNIQSMFFNIDPVYPCLLLCIMRSNIVSSTLDQLGKLPQEELKKPLKVIFVGEEAVDAGGVRKEFFMLIMREILDQKYGMFRCFEESGKIWFNNKSFEEEKMFRLVGLVCGLAIYNHIIISLPFPLALYKKLLGRKTALDDFKQLQPLVVQNLQTMLDYEDEESFQDTFPMAFQIDEDNFGQLETSDLVPNGGQKEVTMQNRAEYVDAYVDYILNASVRKQYAAFSQGFLEVCGGRVLRFFHPLELMAMVIGEEDVNWDEFEENVEYKGIFYAGHSTIKLFWLVFREMSEEDKRKFLVFLTGSDHIPIQGWKSLQVIIQPVAGGEDFFPVAHTCFNLLDLPIYTTKETLKEKLLTAIEHTQGFTLA